MKHNEDTILRSGRRSDSLSLRRRSGVPGCLLAMLLLLTIGGATQAEELVWTTGRVLDAENRPLPGALVAVYDDSNKVVDYTRTDPNGDYALAVPKHLLHLNHKHGQGFIATVVGGAVRFVGGATEFVSRPVRAGVHAVTSLEASNFVDPITRGGITAGGVVVDQMLNLMTPHSHHSPVLVEERKLPGALLLKVVAPDSNDLISVNRLYWLQEEEFKAGGKEKKTLAAWMDPIQLTPADSEKPSKVQSDYLRFTSVRLQPSIAEPGQIVRILAKMPSPPDPAIYTVVVARNNRTGQKWELQPTGDGHYEGEIEIDKHFPHDDQVISILAYASEERNPGRRPDAEKAIEGAGLWDAKKPYLYDPLLVVSRNRADVTLTVVQPSKRRR